MKNRPSPMGNLRRRGKTKGWRLSYDEDFHAELPHVVRFSGGRSSGMLLVSLLDAGALNAARGDIVLFSNTSAEHRATYEFTARMKKYAEEAGIPFFTTEFQTYETVFSGYWSRRPSYRLTLQEPVSSHRPTGYSRNGEIFEEMVAWQGLLPSFHSRFCTAWLKIYTTGKFVSNWLSGCHGLERLGHRKGRSLVRRGEAYWRHLQAGGQFSRKAYLRKQAFLAGRPTFRPAQTFSDYSLPPPSFPRRVQNGMPRFLSLIGFRADELHRYVRMKERNAAGEDLLGRIPGEYCYAPLFDREVKTREVMAFWRRRPAGNRPDFPPGINLSNCVYCFMKGKTDFAGLLQAGKRGGGLPARPGSPEGLNWWIRLEEEYRRPSRNGSTFGLLGNDRGSYRRIKEELLKQPFSGGRRSISGPEMACECTD